MSVAEKIRGLFRRKPLTEDALRAREERRRLKDERRFRNLSKSKDSRLPDAQREIDHWSE